MRNNLFAGAAVTAMAMALALPVAAQQKGAGPGTGSGPRIDTTRPVVVLGEVVSYQAGYGQGTPELVLRDTAGVESVFVLGPFYYLQAQGFVAQVADQVKVSGWACTSCEHAVAVAQVDNLTRSLTLVLRNADGTPVWISGGSSPRRHLGAGNTAPGSTAGQGQLPGTGKRGGQHLCNGAGPDLTRTAVFKGSIVSFTGGAGVGFPTVVIAATGGEVSVVLSPYYVLVQAGYTPTVGALVEVVAAPVSVDGQEHFVALTFKDVATGLELVLRNVETGRPVVMGHGACR
jgi:hypothetical protein